MPSVPRRASAYPSTQPPAAVCRIEVVEKDDKPESEGRRSSARLTSRAKRRRAQSPVRAATDLDASNAVHRGAVAGAMGTGPRGGRKVREREAAAAAGGVAPAAADDDGTDRVRRMTPNEAR